MLRNLNDNDIMSNEQKRQLELLQKIYDTCLPAAPVFKYYHEGVPEGMVPYICTSDLFEYRFNIRILPADEFFTEDANAYQRKEDGKIIARYNSMEELVKDGWVLD